MTNDEKVLLVNLIQQNEGMLKKLAYYFANLNLKNVANFDDYYQEACLALLDIYRNYNPIKGAWSTYLHRSLLNTLSRKSAIWNSQLSANPNVVRLAYRIYILEEKGFSSAEIQEKLHISQSRYLDARNILTREPLQDKVIINQEIWNTFEDIKSILEDDEKQILDLCVAGCSLIEIGKVFNKTNEWARVKVNKLFAKIRNEYV